METTTQDVCLGQRVYGVSHKGDIVPTLIRHIELPAADEDLNDEIRAGKSRKEGPLHRITPTVRCRVLDHTLDEVWLSFDEVRVHAMIALSRLADSETEPYQKQGYADQYATLTQNPDKVREHVDNISAFFESDTKTKSVMRAIAGRIRKEASWTQKSFPKRYHPLGTSVWFSDAKNWQLISGTVTEVGATHGMLTYSCGSHRGLSQGLVYRTKRGAMNCLARMFSRDLPGTLDRARVQVMQQISNAEEAQQIEEYLKNVA